MDSEPERSVRVNSARIAARLRLGVAIALAVAFVLTPQLAILRPSIFGPVWTAAIWGFALVVSFTGWGGWLWRRLLPAHDADLGLRAAWGLCLTVAVGGLLCFFGIARRPVLLAWACGGLALAAYEAFSWTLTLAAEGRRLRDLVPRRWDTPAVAGLLCLVAVAFVGAATRDAPNPNDDWLAYLPFARELAQTGTLIEPFSLRRMASYGGHTLLQALTLLGADDAQIHLFDQGICRVVLVALVLGFSREAARASRVIVVLLACAVFMLPEIRINSSSEASGALALVAVFRTMVWVDRNRARGMRAAFLLALPLAAVCTFRQNYQLAAALMLAALLLPGPEPDGRERRRHVLRVAALTAACLLPWAALAFRSNHTFLFPVFHGNYDPSYAALTPASSWHTRLRLLVAGTIAAEPIRALPLWLLAAFALARKWHRRAVVGLCLATIVGCAALALSLPEADLSSIQRYTFAGLVAFMIGTALAASEYGLTAGSRGDAAIVTVVLLALALQVQGTTGALEKNMNRAVDRLAARDRAPPPLAAQEPDVRRLQQAVPAGERLLVMIERPYLLDFARNRVVLLDQPGAASPAPGLRFSEGGEKVAAYLMRQGIRYFAFVFPDKAQGLYGRATWKRMGAGLEQLWRLAAPVYLTVFDTVDELGKSRRRLYDDGQMAVVDLASRAP
jgi:hypothetical protein